MSTNIEEIIERIAYYDGKFPKEELQILIDNKEDTTPYLLDSIRDPEKCVNELWENEDYLLPFYSLYMLAQFREERAYPLIIELFSQDAEKVDLAFGDLITEDFANILASVSGGDVSPIKKLFDNENADEYVRSAMLKALICLLRAEKIGREELVEYLRELLRRDWEEESFLCSSIALSCLKINAQELLPEVKKKYEAGLIELMFLGTWEHYESDMRNKKFLYTDESNRQHNLVDDMISALEKWAYFRPAEPEPKIRPQFSSIFDDVIEADENIIWDSKYDGTYERETPKVGKNDPCPCGSGRKYKKCCMAF